MIITVDQAFVDTPIEVRSQTHPAKVSDEFVWTTVDHEDQPLRRHGQHGFEQATNIDSSFLRTLAQIRQRRTDCVIQFSTTQSILSRLWGRIANWQEQDT